MWIAVDGAGRRRCCGSASPGSADPLLDPSASSDVLDDELDEIGAAVLNDDLGPGRLGVFALPSRLSRRSVVVEAGPAGGDPFAQSLAGVGEVAVPHNRG